MYLLLVVPVFLESGIKENEINMDTFRITHTRQQKQFVCWMDGDMIWGSHRGSWTLVSGRLCGAEGHLVTSKYHLSSSPK
jgi:hypothetical protein